MLLRSNGVHRPSRRTSKRWLVLELECNVSLSNASWSDSYAKLLYGLINGLNELVGCPRAGCGAPPTIEVQCRLGRLDLLERAALFLQIFDAISNNVGHVPVVGNVGHIADPAAPWKDHSASLS